MTTAGRLLMCVDNLLSKLHCGALIVLHIRHSQRWAWAPRQNCGGPWKNCMYIILLFLLSKFDVMLCFKYNLNDN